MTVTALLAPAGIPRRLATAELVDPRTDEQPGAVWDGVIESVQIRHDMGGRDLDKIGKKTATLTASNATGALDDLLAEAHLARGTDLDVRMADIPASERESFAAAKLTTVREGDEDRVTIKSEDEKLDLSLADGRPFESLGSCITFEGGLLAELGTEDVTDASITGSPLLNPSGGLTTGCKVHIPVGVTGWLVFIERRTLSGDFVLRLALTGAGKLFASIVDETDTERVALSSAPIPTGRWIEIALRWDGKDVEALVDGEVVGAAPATSILPADGPVDISAPTSAPDVRMTGVYWASTAISLEEIQGRILRHPRYDEMDIYTFYYRTDFSFFPSPKEFPDAEALADASGNDLHGRIYEVSLVSSLSGTSDLAGRPRPRVIGLHRATPLFPLDETERYHQGHDGPAIWSEVEVGTVRLWRSISRDAGAGTFDGNLFTAAQPISGFETGQWITFSGTADNPGRWKIAVAGRKSLRIEGRFTSETAPTVTVTTAVPPAILETITIETAAKSGGAARILAPRGTFAEARANQRITLGDTASNDDTYTIAFKPLDPWDELTIIEDFAADEVDVSALMIYEESIDCEVDEDVGTVDFLRSIGHPPTATIEVGDPSAAAVASLLLSRINASFDDRGSRLLGAAPIGVLSGPDEDPKLGRTLGKIGASRGVRIGPRLDSVDLWSAWWSRSPSGSFVYSDLPSDLVTKIRQGTPKEPTASVRALFAPAGLTLGKDDVASNGELREQGDEYLVAEVGSGEPVFEIETLLADRTDAQDLADELLAWLSTERVPFDLDVEIKPDLLEALNGLDETTFLRLDGRRLALVSLAFNGNDLKLKVEEV